jgi:hypothetical protein
MQLPAGIVSAVSPTATSLNAASASNAMSSAQGINMASSAITSAANTYTAYNNAKHEAKMSEISWKANKAIALSNQKINQYISARNKIELLDASGAERLSLQTQELQAQAQASVAFAAFGVKGGSAQQVMHSISREAERAESNRLYQLDSVLFSNKMQQIGIEQRTATSIGSKPIDSISAGLAIGSAASEIGSNLQNIIGG